MLGSRFWAENRVIGLMDHADSGRNMAKTDHPREITMQYFGVLSMGFNE
jgi:hypothetical protein